MQKMLSYIVVIVFACILWIPSFASASATLIQDSVSFEKAKVLEVLSSKPLLVPNSKVQVENQTIKVRFLSGTQKDKEVTLENDFTRAKKGDTLYIRHTVEYEPYREYYSVDGIVRTPWLLFFIIVFLVLTCIFGGWQGVRGIASLSRKYGIDSLCAYSVDFGRSITASCEYIGIVTHYCCWLIHHSWLQQNHYLRSYWHDCDCDYDGKLGLVCCVGDESFGIWL